VFGRMWSCVPSDLPCSAHHEITKLAQPGPESGDVSFRRRGAVTAPVGLVGSSRRAGKPRLYVKRVNQPILGRQPPIREVLMLYMGTIPKDMAVVL
jgi:hypothetical protein